MKENTDQSLQIETTPEVPSKIKNKLVSGRLWLTGVAGLSFLMFVGTLCYIIIVKRDSISTSEISSILNVLLLIISNVMTFYFTKNREDSNSSNETLTKLALKSLDSKEDKKNE